MTQSLSHRGPDDQGSFQSGSIGLGHTRLSVMDTSSQGHQPMTGSDGATTIVFNGEVYNHRELRANLNTNFRSDSDTEVILEQFVQSGSECLKDLDGMFAMAIWNEQTKTLTLARDRFGIKPLYYWYNGRHLVFGSEIKSILASGFVPNEISWQGLHEFLHYGTTLGETTSFDGIRRLPPGHTLELNSLGMKITKFADIHKIPQTRPDYDEATSNVKQLLEDSVKRHLISDVPVGVFLSGGIDSACITAFASKHYGGKLKTYTAAFDFEPENNELEKARTIAQHFGTEHHELTIRANNIGNDIEQLVSQHDVPFGDIANLPLYLMCKELKGDTKVILQGDGGDEIFGGYHRYSRVQQAWFYRAMHYPMMAARPLLSRQSKMYRSLRTLNAFSQRPQDLSAMIMSHQQCDQPVLNVMSDYAKERLAHTNPYAVYHQTYEKLKHLPMVQRMLYTDSSVILPDLYFEKVDRATMAMGVEVRVPMLDNQLCRYAMSLPWQYKVKGRQKKRILRDALRGTIPSSILDGSKKGLNVPFRKWLQKPLNGYLKSILLDSEANSQSLFNKSEVEKMISTHTSGKQEHGMLLYKLLVYTLWHKQYVASPADVTPQQPLKRTA